MIEEFRRLDHGLRMASHRDECLLPDGGSDQRGHHLESRKLHPQILASDIDHVGHHRPHAGDQHLFHPDLTAYREPGRHMPYSLFLCLADPAGVPRSAKQSLVRVWRVREPGGVGTGRNIMVRGIVDRRVPARR